ncbi:hypothetical protein [Rhodopseudomonas palustris]|uniref:hypothetical protein n=1 Tax=Rhodopseudomonas palustris TaxID=1076 RepID=UPI0001649495|nr:hypothetical protein [Rhodopseudomonas palustris]ACF03025.1 hypothetical protein Rpal_4530 [Rhodopseudomonas palustris TIE-1]PPQ43441.1 hypothetical protein CKO39_11805 [Rhodopseudomonas palustris]QLH73005.1 hypothetical protein HZF03_20230 [Rhodopseudomonas palustris]RIA02414.1 hypothetical protein D1920_07975 [Rhodopseudomonas palustris]WBU29178.1 hypothetical protein OOZ54_21305 [Rhodopseudomonas palustris]
MSGDDDYDLTSQFLQSEDMKETRDYLSRGRLLSNVSDGELGDRWVETFKIWLRGEFLIALRNMNDAAAELRLRDLEIPYDQVESEMESIQRAFLQLAPNAGLASASQRIEEFMRDRRKPMN